MDVPRQTRDRARELRREMTLPEVLLWEGLRKRRARGFRFRRQHPIGPYVLDFYCEAAKLAVEVDGQVHGTSGHPERDARRDAWLRRQGVQTLRLPAPEVLADVDAALATVEAKAESAANLRFIQALVDPEWSTPEDAAAFDDLISPPPTA